MLGHDLSAALAALRFRFGDGDGCVGPTATPAERMPRPPTSDSGGTTANASSVGRGPSCCPERRTKVLAAAGDKPYDKTFDDIRFEMKLEDAVPPRDVDRNRSRRCLASGFAFAASSCRRRRRAGYASSCWCATTRSAASARARHCTIASSSRCSRGKTAEFSIRPVAVEGTFGFKEIVGPDGRHLAIYHLDGESVR